MYIPDRDELILAKEQGSKVLTFLTVLEKKFGKNKQSRIFKKIVQDFIKCHLSNPAIVEKYNLVRDIILKIQKNFTRE